MTNDKGIFIKNVYYMLAYAFQILTQKNYEEVEAEKFEEVQDLFAVILAKGVSKQLKQGLYREYVIINEDIQTLRGKLEVQGTIQNYLKRRKCLNCTRDELSVDNIYNQILKTTMQLLVRDASVKSEHKIALKRALLYFGEVGVIDPINIKWKRLVYKKDNKNYEMLMNICYLVLDGMIQTTEKGSYKMSHFSDEHMHRLYEKFVLEYYKRHHSYLDEVKAGQVQWNLSEQADDRMIQFLPIMQTDIFLKYQEKILIIDTKYYGKVLRKQYDKEVLHSSNIYQIFTYVKNQDIMNSGNVSGLLLYAKTEEQVSPDCNFIMGGNKISVKTLDLNQNFTTITAQLDTIIVEFFGDLITRDK